MDYLFIGANHLLLSIIRQESVQDTYDLQRVGFFRLYASFTDFTVVRV